MPIEAVKIPQNVHIEDRIIGPLTLRQIIIMAVGGGVSYAIYASLVKAYGSLDIVTSVIIWIPAVLCAAFALIKINDLSLMRMLFLTLERLIKAPVRTWTPRQGISINIRMYAESEKQQRKRHQVEQQDASVAQNKIQQLSSMIDTAFDDVPLPKESAPVAAPAPAPVAPAVAEPEEVVVPVKEKEAPRTLAVNKDRVKADGAVSDGKITSLSVFRDILPPTQA
jgi:hypothetical protein